MDEEDFYTIKAMTEEGGSFVKRLAALAAHADPVNLAKIKTTWRDYWDDYREKGQQIKSRER